MTIAIDSSALVAILNGEPEGPAFAQALALAADARISVASVMECTIKGAHVSDEAAIGAVDGLISAARIEIAPVDVRQLDIARRAYLAFGKGRGHPAQLNFGDCFSYALAKSLDAPLLFKGEDFTHTDVKRAM